MTNKNAGLSVLLVVAHPDDEVLGAGATAAALARQAVPVRACILSGQADARNHKPSEAQFNADLRRAQRILGIGEPILGHFPNLHLNREPHLALVQFIESAIVETAANVIFTHHPGDLNNDHLHTSMACQAAARLFQRRPGVPSLRALFFMEIPSATDWAFAGTAPVFRPDTYFHIGGTLRQKLNALRAYRGVMRRFPHPRSEEVIRGLAAYRGGASGMEYAEAFQAGFQVLGALGLSGATSVPAKRKTRS